MSSIPRCGWTDADALTQADASLQLLSPLQSLRGFTVIIEGEIVSADTALAAYSHAPPDRAGDLDSVFEAGTAMELLHGQCMFSLIHDIKPHLLRSEVEF
jgi:hypothetical protein